MSADKRIDAYLKELGRALRQLDEKDRSDILSEIRTHLEHRAGEDRLNEALRSLGAPAQCARGFLEELKIQNAFADGGASKSVGALFELASNSTGEIFYQGKIDDPSMSQALYIAVFPREDGTMAVAWQRPRRRNSQLGTAEYGEGDMFAGDEAGSDTDISGDGLGDSTATPPAKRGRGSAKDSGTSEDEGTLPPMVDA